MAFNVPHMHCVLYFEFLQKYPLSLLLVFPSCKNITKQAMHHICTGRTEEDQTTYILVVRWRWLLLKPTPTHVAEQRWRLSDEQLLLSGMSLAAFDETHTLVVGWHWWHLRITSCPCDRSSLAAFQINTYSWGRMALVAFEKKQT